MKWIQTGLIALAAAAAFAGGTPTAAAAQDTYTVNCRSEEYRYRTCALNRPGWVELQRQESRSACTKGRTWDYNRREIWVDDGCGGVFRVHPGGGSGDGVDGGDVAAAAGILIGAAVLGALLDNDDHDDDHKYQDDRWQGSRHSSYVPSWMIGTFRGYNAQYGSQVTLTVNADGRAVAMTDDGRNIPGWINNQELHVGDAIFDVDRTHDGFVTHPLGTRHNELQYRRVGVQGPSGQGGASSQASGYMPCSYGSPAYDRTCQWTVTRHGSGTFATATIHVETPRGTWRDLHYELGEGTGQPRFYSPGADVQMARQGDLWMVNVNDREFFRFPDAVITGG